MNEQVPGTVERLREAIDTGDPARVAACFTEDYDAVLPLHPARDFVGNEQVGRNWAVIFARVPDLRAEVLRFATRDGETWSDWELRGTAADGTPVTMRGPAIWTERDGLIASSRFYLDAVS